MLRIGLGKPVSFLAKSTLFGNPFGRLTTGAFNAIPVYRQKDGVDTKKNEETFDLCRAMLRNMAVSLLRHETIRTTIPKAKELRRVVEPLITLGKVDTEAKRRLAFSRLRDAKVVEKLFSDLGPRFKARAGG